MKCQRFIKYCPDPVPLNRPSFKAAEEWTTSEVQEFSFRVKIFSVNSGPAHMPIPKPHKGMHSTTPSRQCHKTWRNHSQFRSASPHSSLLSQDVLLKPHLQQASAQHRFLSLLLSLHPRQCILFQSRLLFTVHIRLMSQYSLPQPQYSPLSSHSCQCMPQQPILILSLFIANLLSPPLQLLI